MQNHPTRSSRRGFLKGALASPLAAQVVAQTQSSANGIPTRPLGRTGVQVSILGIGGSPASRLREEADASRFFHAAVDNGITFMDNAWEYGNGRAEEIMGRALAEDGLRKKCFLMTKVCERDYSGAMTQLEDSLKKLRTDYLDLWQFHECNYHNDPEYLMEKGGLRAAMEAKRQGKVRFVGFTGHKHPTSTTSCSAWISPGTPARCRTTSWIPALSPSASIPCPSAWSAASALSA
jgi:hypothetical protein